MRHDMKLTGLEELMLREASKVPGWKLGPMEPGLFEAQVILMASSAPASSSALLYVCLLTLVPPHAYVVSNLLWQCRSWRPVRRRTIAFKHGFWQCSASASYRSESYWNRRSHTETGTVPCTWSQQHLHF